MAVKPSTYVNSRNARPVINVRPTALYEFLMVNISKEQFLYTRNITHIEETTNKGSMMLFRIVNTHFCFFDLTRYPAKK